MKLAIQHAFPNYALVAETELLQRFAIAARNLGWQVLEAVTSDDIMRFRPDCILATHYSSPKLTEFITLGMMTNPVQYFGDSEEHIRNILSYDGYLSGSPRITQYLRDLLFPIDKRTPISDFPFLLSTHETEFIERPAGDRRLFYVGTRWDAGRHGSLFEKLSKRVPLDVYGPANRWAGVDCNYRGEIRGDGRSLLVRLRDAGVALCVHSREHREWQLPTMRVFEAAAAGAVILADDIPMVREHFGRTILPVDFEQPLEVVVNQIAEHLEWINSHPLEATAMARQAHTIFRDRFCLERVFERLPCFLDHVRHVCGLAEHGHIGRAAAAPLWPRRRFAAAVTTALHTAIPGQPPSREPSVDVEEEAVAGEPMASPQVEYILCIGAASPRQVDLCLRSIAEQSYKSIGIIAVRNTAGQDIDDVLNQHARNVVSMKVVAEPKNGAKSNALWAGLRAVSAPFFASIQPVQRLHRNHVASLMGKFSESPEVMLAQASAIEVRTEDGPFVEQWNFSGPLGQQIPETRRLLYLGAIRPDALLDRVGAAGATTWIACRMLLDTAVMQDPHLSTAEDVYLCLLLHKKSRAVCSWRPTCEWHEPPRAECPLLDAHPASALKRVRSRLNLVPGRDLSAEIEQLQRQVRDLQKELPQLDSALIDALGRQMQASQHDLQPEAHALRRLSQAYLGVRGLWKILSEPLSLPRRSWRGLRTLARNGQRRFLIQVVQVGRRS